MTPLSIKQYCPKSKYGLSVQDLIKRAVNHEDYWNSEYTAPPLPKHEKQKFKFTIASAVGFAGDIIWKKGIMNNLP